MKKFLLLALITLFCIKPSYAFDFGINSDIRSIKRLLNSQVKWANKTDFNKFISTYDNSYVNSDGFNYDTYSEMVKDIWNTYDKIKYGIKIKNIKINDQDAIAELTETSYAQIPLPEVTYTGELKSLAESVYYLKKINGKWKVVSDEVQDETTSMLYGDAKNLDIKLTVPNKIKADTEYTASLEFVPPKDAVAIASIASDIVEYPQKPLQEVFRPMPDDNILERLFTSNNQKANEYIVASIGLTKTSICDLSIKLSLTGFGYKIKRVNVTPVVEGNNDKNE